MNDAAAGRAIASRNQRLATGAKNMVPGSRMGTGAPRGDPNYVSIGMATAGGLKFNHRPVTKQEHGLTGLQSKAQTHERQFYDKNFYVTQIVKKNTEMTREIENFKKQTEDITRDNQVFLTLEKKYEQLTKEVRKLEGELANYNLAFDKLRAGARPEDINSMYEHVKLQNERLRAHLDELFIERRSYEEQIQAFEGQLNEIHQAAEMKLNELDPDQRNEYENLLNENRQLVNNINAQRSDLEDLNMILSQADSKLRMDDKKQKYKMLKEQIMALERKKEDLEFQTNENNLTFPEARDRLLAKVKEDNNFIMNADKRMKDIKRMIENYEKQLREMNMDLEEKKSEEHDKQKYEILYQKDKEMTEFIDTFEDTRRKEMDNISKIEQSIVEALEHSSKVLITNTDLPNKEQFLQIQNELAHKKTHQENAEVTLQRLRIEYDQRSSDIKNFGQLEERMTTEMMGLNEKLDKMNDEMNNKFNNIGEYRKESEDNRQNLLSSREALRKQSQQIKEELISVSYDYEKKKQKLNLHDQHKVLSALEKTFSQNEGQLYSLRSFIKSRTVDMDYKGLIAECNGMVEGLNKVLLQQNGVK